MGIIYCAQNKVNGKRYIGQSVNSLEQRRRGYLGQARRGRPQPVFDAIREFGEDAFEWSVLFDDVDDEDLDEYEIDAIAVYKTLVPNGYNLSRGGNGSSKESRKKLSESKKNLSAETRDKIRQARIGKSHSEETLKKMSDAKKGKKRGPLPEETKRKMSEAGKIRCQRRRVKLLNERRKQNDSPQN